MGRVGRGDDGGGRVRMNASGMGVMSCHSESGQCEQVQLGSLSHDH
jgi:hypothetical protein